MALASTEPRGTVPTLSQTTVPPRPIVTRDRSNPVSVIDTWWPLGGVGGGELDVEVEVEVDEVDDELEVELELVVAVELELDVDVELELDADEVEVDVDVLDVETLAVGDGVGDDEAHVGGIGSGAGRTGCQFGSMSVAALVAG
jgi:hypothetical protein